MEKWVLTLQALCLQQKVCLAAQWAQGQSVMTGVLAQSQKRRR